MQDRVRSLKTTRPAYFKIIRTISQPSFYLKIIYIFFYKKYCLLLDDAVVPFSHFIKTMLQVPTSVDENPRVGGGPMPARSGVTVRWVVIMQL